MTKQEIKDKINNYITNHTIKSNDWLVYLRVEEKDFQNNSIFVRREIPYRWITQEAFDKHLDICNLDNVVGVGIMYLVDL